MASICGLGLQCYVASPCFSASRLVWKPNDQKHTALGSFRKLNGSGRSPLYSSDRARASWEDATPTDTETPKIRQLVSLSSVYNDITVIEVPKNMRSEFAGYRLLLLDESRNIHSIYRDDCKWTNAYWDQFASLPPIIPEGPIAILGLGGGTAARLMLDLWPSRRLLGWEIDEILIDVARNYFGLSELETLNPHGGVLEVFVDDALQSSSVTVDDGFAGIIVDLFANGEILPQLKQPDTWFELRKKLKDGGRIMVNCGGTCVERSDPKSQLDDGTWTWEDGGYATQATLYAMSKAFPELLYRELGSDSDNYIALTGPLPDFPSWASALPKELRKGLTEWRKF